MTHTSLGIRILCALLPALVAGAAEAQSIFGLNFIGEHRFRGSARQRSLAFSAIALPDSNSAITSNTASLADLRAVTFSVFEAMQFSRIRTETESADQNRFQLPAVMAAVPLTRGLVFGLGYRTRFEGRGDFSYPVTAPGAPNGLEIYRLRSTLFTAPLSLSWRPVSRFALAGELMIERGSITDDVTVAFPGAESYSSVSSRRSRDFSATSWSASVLLELLPRLRFGATVDGAIDYTVEERLSFSRDDLDSTAALEFNLPASYGLGVAVGLSKRWWLAASYWTRRAPDPAGFAQLEGSLDDERLFAAGLERSARREGGLLSRVPLRFGYYENRWHLEFPAGEAVVSRFVTLGTGLSIPGGPGSIDLSLEFGQIGSVSQNGVDERVMRVGVGLNVSETWSRRRPGGRSRE